MLLLIYVFTSCSKHFIITEVSATGLKSFIQVAVVFLGTGIIIDFLKQFGTTQRESDKLKMSVKTEAS